MPLRYVLLTPLFLVLLIEPAAATTPQATQEVNGPAGLGISANPAAVQDHTGSGEAQRFVLKQFGVKNDHGMRFGGLWLADCNWLITGGEKPGAFSCNSALVLDNSIDLRKLTGWWAGGSFGAEFLQLDASPTNSQAGSVQGYNSTPGPDPLTRSELYELWIRQQLFRGKLVVRVGKVTPTRDFGNVLRPVPTQDAASFIPAVSGLLYTPVFKNPTLYGASPGFYNSAGGVTLNLAPVKWWYVNYGAYDGNLARGVQTGEKGPTFNGYYFQIAETGFAWRLGPNRLPGQAGAGLWRQTGVLQGPPGISEDGTDGVYTFGSQRLWFRDPGRDNAGVSTFLQVGHNGSKTLPINQFFGGGFTGFGLVPSRPNDSTGIGVAWSRLNRNIFKRSSELMLQSYYQARVSNGIYLQPTLTYIPTPGASPNYNSAWAATLRLIVLF
ncbi:MAG: carbohydrate porin [Acidobacteriaceae bacterium]